MAQQFQRRQVLKGQTSMAFDQILIAEKSCARAGIVYVLQFYRDLSFLS